MASVMQITGKDTTRAFAIPNGRIAASPFRTTAAPRSPATGAAAKFDDDPKFASLVCQTPLLRFTAMIVYVIARRGGSTNGRGFAADWLQKQQSVIIDASYDCRDLQRPELAPFHSRDPAVNIPTIRRRNSVRKHYSELMTT